MAKQNKPSIRTIKQIIKRNENITDTADQMIDGMQSMIYGAVPSKEINSLDNEFDNIIRKEISSMTSKMDGDVSSFLEKLYSDNQKKDAGYMKDIEDIFKASQTQISSILTEAYRNKLLKRADIHEVASQLNELKEAILITRDAIVASDVIDGHICRTIGFKNSDTKEAENYTSIVEKMEQRFKLHYKIKNFVVPKTLEQGEYYANVMPYSEIFSKFLSDKVKGKYTNLSESTVMESASNDYITANPNKTIKDASASICNELYDTLLESTKEEITAENKRDALNDIKHLLENVTVCNDPVPLAMLDEGVDALQFYKEHCTDGAYTESSYSEVRNTFNMLNDIDGKGITSGKDAIKEDEIKDCYLRFIDSMHLIPIKIMTETIGYYYIQEDALEAVAQSNYYNFYDADKEKNLVSAIAGKIVNAFDKKFLKDNMGFKSLIVDALQYYNLHERKIKFQYIPAENIVPFRINEDDEGNGTSVIEPALFYAKLYLLLLLFKMVSIVSSSNDTKVHYIKTSGIDKNVSNAVQEIARKMQARQINLTDMFSYTTLVNKVGNGSELFVPLGRGDARGIETEILAGQDIQLNSDLMDLLRTSYISATGVPAVIMNNINESEFAKTIELGNTRFQARVVSEQLDFNQGITDLYKKILKYSSSIPENVIDTFSFEFQAPKHAGSQVTNELLSNFDQVFQFAVSLAFDQSEVEAEGGGSSNLLRSFKQAYAKDKLPLINVDRILELAKEAKVESKLLDLDASRNDEPEEEETEQQ